MSSKIVYTVAIASMVWLCLAMLANSEVSDVCLRCICEALTGCNLTKTCTGVACGLFHITWGYWADGGKLTLDGESPESHTAYPNCANDPTCAGNTVKNYMQTFERDCNGDNQIDCYDHAAIHKLGHGGCTAGIYGPYLTELKRCLNALDPTGK